MTKQRVLKEEDISTEFNAYETLPVYRYLDRIYACNQGNDSAIEEFEKCLSKIKQHLAYRCMASGYPDNIKKISNQIMKFTELGITLIYEVIQSDNYGGYYVNIIRIGVDFGYFGLTKPMPINHKKQMNEYIRKKYIFKESQLRKIICETVRMVLKERRNRRLNEAVVRSFHRVLREHLTRNR